MVSLPNHKLRMVSMSNHHQGRGRIRIFSADKRGRVRNVITVGFARNGGAREGSSLFPQF